MTLRRPALGRPAMGDLASLATVGLVLVLPLAGLWHYQGPPMEEGHMLAFPAELLKGNVANRDFLHLYGPGSLWVLAGAFKLFGSTLATERSIGFLQHTLLAFGMWFAIRPVGRWTAALAGSLAALVVVTPLGLTAMAWNGAIAAGIWCAAAAGRAMRAHAAGDQQRARRAAIAAGVCGGIALLYRPDLLLAVGAALGLVWWTTRAVRKPLSIAFVGTGALVLIHVAMAGVGASFRGMFVEPVFELRAGRSLPVPPSWGSVDGHFQRGGLLRTQGWSLPQPAVSHQIVAWFWLSILVTLGLLAAAWWMGRDADLRDAPTTPGLRAAALFGALLVTQILQRPDSAHLAWVTCVSFGVAVGVTVAVVRAKRPAWHLAAGPVIATAAVVVLLVAVIPFFPARSYVDVVSSGLRGEPFGSLVERDGRRFYLADPAAARDAQRIVDRLGRDLRPGQSLVESPVDLSRTVYSEAFFYYLFPELRAGTRFIEMDPGVTNARDSGFAREVSEADWLLLTKRWEDWTERNDARVPGDRRPLVTARRDFCTVLDTPNYELKRRCR